MKSTVDLYLNADRTAVVLESDPTASSLLVNAGREIPDAEVTAMGVGILEQAQKLGNPEAPAEDKAAPEQESETKQEEPSEDKSVEAPAEDKAAGKGSQKSK